MTRREKARQRGARRDERISSVEPARPAEPNFAANYPTAAGAKRLLDERLYVNAVTAYLWALPVLNISAMKEASERTFGHGYNVLPIWKRRLDAKTLITTPNSDVIYAMGYLDLKYDGPLVIDVPPGLQGVLDDFFQRPLRSIRPIGGRDWSGDVGLPGPDRGKGGKYLVLPPDYDGEVPESFFAFRSRTYGVFLFWRGFFKDPLDLGPPVRVMEQTRVYPFVAGAEARPMEFPDASGVALNMLPPRDDSAFDILKRFIDHEYVDASDLDMRGVLASIGIARDRPFEPDEHARTILSRAASRASEIARLQAYQLTPERAGARYYSDRQWVNGFPPFPGNPEFVGPTYTDLDLRAGFFEAAYSTSPGMTLDMPNVGAKYPSAFTDSTGEFLVGDRSYRLHLPANIPAKLFWSVTVYDAATASGLDNGQAFPSINAMDAPATNADGSIDIRFGPAPRDRNWLATIPHKGFFVILRLYGPTESFFDRSWKPSDIERIEER